MRSLLFTLWIQSDKSLSATLALLEKLTAAQFETVQQGGARMINASIAGKSFTYDLPPNWGAFEFEKMLYQAWKKIETGGATGGRMSDAELRTYILDTSNEETDTMLARINYNNHRR
ncbi:MAG: hypothetical protein ACPIG6_06315 [Akkermansiaceae bacterium]